MKLHSKEMRMVPLQLLIKEMGDREALAYLERLNPQTVYIDDRRYYVIPIKENKNE